MFDDPAGKLRRGAPTTSSNFFFDLRNGCLMPLVIPIQGALKQPPNRLPMNDWRGRECLQLSAPSYVLRLFCLLSLCAAMGGA
jgi:hypothetical protein